MTKAIYEVLNEVAEAGTDATRIAILRENDTFALRCVLRAALHPRIRFVIDHIPEYRPNESPAEMSENSLHREVNRIYLFEENNPRVDPNLTLDRRYVILTQMLESIEAEEAIVLSRMFMKDLSAYKITPELADEALPGTLA